MDKKIKRNREAIRPDWNELREARNKQEKQTRPDQFLTPPENAERIKLNTTFSSIKQKDLTTCIQSRRTLRKYNDEPLLSEELSYLLWETCRVMSVKRNATFRTIPTAGATNGMETFIYVYNVGGLKHGLYQYVQNDHELAFIKSGEDLEEKVDEAILGQLRQAPVVFFFTAICPRSEYRYLFAAHKMLAIEAGHACQNLALAAEVIDAGICPICAYDQTKANDLLKLDGDDMFVTYCATVGKK